MLTGYTQLLVCLFSYSLGEVAQPPASNLTYLQQVESRARQEQEEGGLDRRKAGLDRWTWKH